MVGWSDGSITAMILAAKYPESIKRLVLFGANAYVTKKDVELCEGILAPFNARYDAFTSSFAGIADLSKWSDRMRAPFLAMYGDEYFRRMWAEWLAAYKK